MQLDRVVIRYFALAAFGLFPAVSSATEFTRPPLTVPGAEPRILRGTPAGARQWPATRASTTSTSAGNFRCTATLIGPRTVLTAAHCVDNGATMSIEVEGPDATVTCTHHSKYSGHPDYDNDIALCLATTDLRLPQYERYERLNTERNVLRQGARVQLLGFGCTTPGGDVSRYLYTGSTRVTSATGALIATADGASVCEGDSGGAAYWSARTQSRVVIGVNSTRSDDFQKSFLTNVAAPSISDFIRKWVADNSASVCGYGAPSSLCHR